eukprot:6204538-Pleurochrysis_carterae.AAC.1
MLQSAQHGTLTDISIAQSQASSPPDEVLLHECKRGCELPVRVIQRAVPELRWSMQDRLLQPRAKGARRQNTKQDARALCARGERA